MTLENRMVHGEYYEDEAPAEELDELPFEAFDRKLLAAWSEAMGG